jgi:hypothetical protein
MAKNDITFYPIYLFPHSPTYTAWARLTAADIQHYLRRRAGYVAPDLWFFGQTNHPIRWVRVVGVVVAIDEWETRTQFVVDDGSGEVIDVLTWNTPRFGDEENKEARPRMEGVGVGAVVKVKGSVTEWRGRKQIALRKVETLRDTSEEIKCWREMEVWKREVLMVPWTVDGKTMRKEKRKARKMQMEEGMKRKVRDDEEEERKRFQGRRRGGLVPPKRERSPTQLGNQESSGDSKKKLQRRRPEGHVLLPSRSRSPPLHEKDPPLEHEKDGTAQFHGRRRPPDYRPLLRPERSPTPPKEPVLGEKCQDRPLPERSPSADLAPVAKTKQPNYSDLEFGETLAVAIAQKSVLTKVETWDDGIGTTEEAKSDLGIFRGRRRLLDHEPPPKLPPSPGSRLRSPGSRGRCDNDLEFDNVKGPARPKGRKVNTTARSATPSIKGREETRGKRFPVVASDLPSGKRRRIRTVPTEKFMPPPVPAQIQEPLVQVKNSTHTLRFPHPVDEPTPHNSTFNGRRRPGTVRSNTVLQQLPSTQQGSIWSQSSLLSGQFSSQIAEPRIPPAFEGCQEARPEASPQGIETQRNRISTSTFIQQDSYSVRSFQPPPSSQPPVPTFRGQRRTQLLPGESQLPDGYIGPSTYTRQDPYTFLSSQPLPSSQLPRSSQTTFKGRRRAGTVQAQAISQTDERDVPPLAQRAPSAPPSDIVYDDIPSTFSTYHPTPAPIQPSSQTCTFRGRRRAQPQPEEPTSSQLMPPPQPPRKSTSYQLTPRALKATILSYLQRTNAAVTSAQSLVSAPELAALTACTAAVTPALQALAADGYLLPMNVPGAWTVVGYPQLRDIIDVEVKEAMRRSRDKVVLVGKVWRKASQRGGCWAGVGKEVVREVLGTFFGDAEDWMEIKGGWEWKGG